MKTNEEILALIRTKKLGLELCIAPIKAISTCFPQEIVDSQVENLEERIKDFREIIEFGES